jgi:hypothetical protein
MGAFKSEKLVHTSLTEFDGVAEDLTDHFAALGYDVTKVRTDTGTWDVSVSKGGRFKAVAGLKTALKVLLQPETDGVTVYAGIGIFGKQAAPALLGVGAIRVALLAGGAAVSVVALPLLVAQVWGLVRQARLDDEAIRLVENSIRAHERQAGIEPVAVLKPVAPQRPVTDGACPSCAEPVPPRAAFCGSCGTRLA